MWKPIHLHVEVQGRVFALRRRGDGWEDVGAALPPLAWGEIEGEVLRAVRGRQVLSGLATLMVVVGMIGLVGRALASEAIGLGQTSGGGSLGPLVLTLLGVQFLRMAIRIPIRVACAASMAERKCVGCGYALVGLAIDKAGAAVCPECGVKN